MGTELSPVFQASALSDDQLCSKRRWCQSHSARDSRFFIGGRSPHESALGAESCQPKATELHAEGVCTRENWMSCAEHRAPSLSLSFSFSPTLRRKVDMLLQVGFTISKSTLSKCQHQNSYPTCNIFKKIFALSNTWHSTRNQIA